jgi:chemotaxis signal transduction protein
MDLLLSTLDLREVVSPTPVAPLPGSPRGIQGVVIHQGEFLPVLAWEDLPGCLAQPAPPMALAVLRPRLGVPLERIIGTIDLPPGARREADETDPAMAWLGGVGRMGDRDLPMVDPDRLVALLRRFRAER